MKDYFTMNEQNDLQLMYEFNYETKLFQSIKPTEEKSQYDAIGVKGKREFAIELKHRYVDMNKYQSMFIEDYKLAALMLEYILNGKEPLYVCFLQGGVVLIYNLLKLTRMPQLRIQNIKSEGYEKMQCQERRYCLSLDDAVIYKDNNLIKSMGEKWKTMQQYS
jgi:hypothetical protein